MPKAMLDSLSLSSDPSVMAASAVVSLIGLAAFLAIAAVRHRKS